MANIIGIIAMALVAIGAYLGYQNKTKFEEQITFRDDAEEDREQAQEDYQDQQAEIEEVKEQVAQLEEELEEAETALAQQESQTQEAEEELKEAKELAQNKKEEIEAIREQTESLGGLEEMVERLTENQKQVAALESSLTNIKNQAQQLKQQRQKLVQRVENLTARKAIYGSNQSSPDLRTRVSQVYNSVGFVTLAGGDNAGVIQGSTLDVVRGGEIIGQLQVRTVEAGTASADIIPDSFTSGTSVRAGDTVVASSSADKKSTDEQASN